MPDFTAQLSEPAYISLTVNGKTVRLDAYEARRVCEDAAKQPSEDHRHKAILDYLAKQSGVPRDQLAQNQAVDFNDLVVTIIARLVAERQKKTSAIACWPDSTPASQPDSEGGP